MCAFAPEATKSVVESFEFGGSAHNHQRGRRYCYSIDHQGHRDAEVATIIDAVELVLPVRDVMICLDFQGIIAWNDFDFEANAGWSSEPRASASQLLHPPTTTTCLASTAPPSSTPHSATDDAQPTVAKPCSSVSPLLDDLSEAPP